ncbi:nucleoside hydrolase [Rapidithrix thailandica]|uniref:Nucleoside hydrolase n=1 Tax=Rapidithrix thailandica TaxID=413964 RepID=A0AAW9SC78_9BACT
MEQLSADMIKVPMLLRNTLLLYVFFYVSACSIDYTDTPQRSEGSERIDSLLNRQSSPCPVIFDTDMGPDYEDAGALALLHTYADSGYVKILATMTSNRSPYAAQVVQIINTYYRGSRLPVGKPGQEAPVKGAWQKWPEFAIKQYARLLPPNHNYEKAVNLYRKQLAAQPDKSVRIISTGFFSNLDKLLTSAPDSISPLTGKELVKQKVQFLAASAGWLPMGKDFNIVMDTKASTHVLEEWPTPLIFCTFEIGSSVKTGKTFQKLTPNNPAAGIYQYCMGYEGVDNDGRMSNDMITVMLASRGYQPYFLLQAGTMKLDERQNTYWESDITGNHFRLFYKRNNTRLQHDLEKALQHQPAKLD